MKGTSLRPHLSMLGVTVIFGLNYSITKSLMSDCFSPLQLVFVRLLGGVLLFWIFQRLFVPEKVERRDLIKLALCGLFGLSLNVTLFYIGLDLTTPVDASIIHVSSPILVLLLSALLIGEAITFRKMAGIATGMFGALILILWGRKFQFGGQTALGNALVLGNMLFYALYLVLIKPLVGKYHTTTILKWVSFFGFLFIIPVSVKPIMSVSFEHISWFGWAGLFFVIVINTFLAYLLINYSLKHLTPTSVSYYTYLQPFLAAITSVSAGIERVTFPKIIAAILIFTGVYLVTGRKKGTPPLEEIPERK